MESWPHLHLLLHHENDNAAVVKTTPTSAATHLDVLARGHLYRHMGKKIVSDEMVSVPTTTHQAKVLAVKLPRARKNNRAGGHVETHGKGLGRKKSLDWRA